MTDSRESKNPQLNIRPGDELYGRLAILGAVNRVTPPEMARRLLTEAVEQIFEENPGLVEAQTHIQELRKTMLKES
jgi:hypothetical protein